jgi:hypothetical protein
MRERGRCLWVLDQIVAELQVELARKLLIESERHVVGVKVKLARAIVLKAKRGIVSGAKPKGADHGRADDLDATGRGEGAVEGLPPPSPSES